MLLAGAGESLGIERAEEAAKLQAAAQADDGPTAVDNATVEEAGANEDVAEAVDAGSSGEDEANESEVDEVPLMTDEAVTPSGLFSCKPKVWCCQSEKK